MFRNTLLLSATLALGGASVSAAATVAFFDNYPYNQYYGYFVCGMQECGVYSALQFVPGATGTTTKVSIPVSSYMDYSSRAQVIIRADNNGIPGKVLAKKDITAAPCCVSTTVKMTAHLTSGTAYWLEVAPRLASTYVIWQQSSSPGTCTVASKYDGGAWTTSSTTSCPAGKITGN